MKMIQIKISIAFFISMLWLSYSGCVCKDCNEERIKTKTQLDEKKGELQKAKEENKKKITEIESLNQEIKKYCTQLETLRNQRKKDTAQINALIKMLSGAIEREETLVKGLDAIIKNRDYINYFYYTTDSVVGIDNDTLFKSKSEAQDFFSKLYNTKNNAMEFVNDAKVFRDNMQDSQIILKLLENEKSQKRINDLKRELALKEDSLKTALKKIGEQEVIITDKTNENARLSNRIHQLETDNNNLHNRIDNLTNTNNSLNIQLVRVKQERDSLIDVMNMRPNVVIVQKKIKITRQGCYEIPITINKNGNVKNEKNYIIYMALGRKTETDVDGGYIEPIYYIKKNDGDYFRSYDGQNWAYNGTFKFKWSGQEISDGIIQVWPKDDKSKIKLEDLKYNYLIFERDNFGNEKFIKGSYGCTAKDRVGFPIK